MTATTLPAPAPARTALYAQIVLIVITFAWGGTFLAVQTALQWTGPYTLVGMRFGLAAVLLAMTLGTGLRGLTRTELKAGGLIGIALFFGYGFQTLGLQYIPSSKSAFLTALYVPLVPLLIWLVFRRLPTAAALLGVALAFTGMVLLSNPGSYGLVLGKGEILTIICALATASEILLISHFAKRCNARRVVFVQLLVVSLLAFPAAFIAGESQPQATPGLIMCISGLAFVLAMIQFGMNWAQRYVSATRATLTYAMEPVWAGIIGALFGERLGLWGTMGGVLIVLGVLVSELKFGRKLRPVQGVPPPSH